MNSLTWTRRTIGAVAPETLTEMNGLAWSKGALYALVRFAVIRISLPGG